MSSYYITPEKAMLAMGRATFIKLFDDDNSRRANDAAVMATIARASARTTAAMAHNYPGDVPFASPIPEMAEELTLAYFTAFAWMRSPDMMKGADISSAKLLASADQLAKMLRDVIVHVIDALPNPTATNTGGSVGTIGILGGVRPSPQWSDMGDF